MLLIFVYVALLSYNVEYLTLPLVSLECMVDHAGNVAILDHTGRPRKGGSKRFVRDMEEREQLERELELSRAKGGKSRRQSKSGSGVTHRSKDKSKRKSSKSQPNYDMPPVDAVSRYRDPQASLVSPISPYGYYDHATYPFLGAREQSVQAQHDASAPRRHALSPNWSFIWNEGTDAVMDVPIGGVCEVLYG
jgi:hypothetical protein